jgi:AbrB family looped-hinge helix DNA binding protein
MARGHRDGEHVDAIPPWDAALRPMHSKDLREGGLSRDSILTILKSVRNEELTVDTEATLTSKGQTTIPKSIRDTLGMKAGDRMTFTLMPDGVVLMRVKNKRVTDLAGVLHKKGRKPVPLEQLSR